MVKLLQVKLFRGFTMIESLLTLLILIILLNISLSISRGNKFTIINDELSLDQLISKFDYYKSKAIGDKQSITLALTENSSIINVVEEKGSHYSFKIQNGKIKTISKIKKITFDKDGRVNNFGSFVLNINERLYKVIFHIDKGRIRYVSL
ncbi:competence protein [Staphylococcus petrasii]|uniref:Competence protein n=2 Tax=Staphylococcus petrasii TaxID=1276936 RepID=A0ABY2KZR9_9STAP|nr:competence protein [Staphylococcus petrasii]TGE13314.1 competence protein [Staphylococcus petrasii]TGE19402.1 competence protein [Staphylococcus petrasii]